MFRKIIHWLVMPCSQATQEIEKQQGGCKMSLLQKQRLKTHLAICKWCTAYKKKVVILDKKLNSLIQKQSNQQFKETDIQLFKDNLKEEIKK